MEKKPIHEPDSVRALRTRHGVSMEFIQRVALALNVAPWTLLKPPLIEGWSA